MFSLDLTRPLISVQDDWDASEDEKPKTSAPIATAAAGKKKMSLKQKLAEKERQSAEPVRWFA